MPYADPEKQRAAQKRSYERRRNKIAANRKAKRPERSEYVRNLRKELEDYVKLQKLDKTCLDCGNRYPPYVMDYDHCRGEPKIATVRVLVNHCYSKETIDAEIAKCDLVCANCHRERTFGVRPG